MEYTGLAGQPLVISLDKAQPDGPASESDVSVGGSSAAANTSVDIVLYTFRCMYKAEKYKAGK
jgi:hypothetical protein